jgi:uncharacterized protein
MITVGLMLGPSEELLELLGPVLARDCEHFELTPETTWYEDGAGALFPNAYHRRFLELKRRTRRPFLAHGVGVSLGGGSPRHAARRRRLLARMREDHALFGFRWYTDHLGATAMDGLAMTLPIPLPMTAHAAKVVRRRLAQMQRVVPHVGVENNVPYLLFGAPLEEPRFLNEVTRGKGTHLLLDLHNLYTFARNHGVDAREYLSRLKLDRVIELHLSGGTPADPAWLPSRRSLWLDSHDTPVPEEVWALLDEVAPRCPGLKAVTLERIEGSVAQGDVPLLREELARARRAVRS